jgi:hypothetical protein
VYRPARWAISSRRRRRWRTIPEFKGNVVAVQTGKYWDHELEALVEKSGKVAQKKAELQYQDGLTGEALNKAYAEYRAKHITPEEEELLKRASPTPAFHYLGSAKIMCGIGKGFAEAMIGLQEAVSSSSECRGSVISGECEGRGEEDGGLNGKLSVISEQ